MARNVFIPIICATMLACSGLSMADEYRPGEFLSLDLSKAVLSPRPLGPAAGFAPGPLDVTVDRGSSGVQARAEPAAEPKIAVRNSRIVRQRTEPPRHEAPLKLARQHRNPVDAQAFDARVQVWPCKSGGICNWKR